MRKPPSDHLERCPFLYMGEEAKVKAYLDERSGNPSATLPVSERETHVGFWLVSWLAFCLVVLPFVNPILILVALVRGDFGLIGLVCATPRTMVLHMTFAFRYGTGASYLQLAAWRGSAACVALLLDAGADIHHTTWLKGAPGVTAFSIAKAHHAFDPALLKRMDPSLQPRGVDVRPTSILKKGGPGVSQRRATDKLIAAVRELGVKNDDACATATVRGVKDVVALCEVDEAGLTRCGFTPAEALALVGARGERAAALQALTKSPGPEVGAVGMGLYFSGVVAEVVNA